MKENQFFDIESFRTQAIDLVNELCIYLNQTIHAENKVLNYKAYQSLYNKFEDDFPTSFNHSFDIKAFLKEILSNSIHLHHPHFIGHQVSSPLLDAVLCDMVSSMLNNGSAVYEMGPMTAVMEHKLINWMNEMIGWSPSHAGGLFTSGGSLGNLTALLAARQSATNYDFWSKGASYFSNLAIMVSQQNHYCIKRAAHIIGLGDHQIIEVPCNDMYKMNMVEAKRLYQDAIREGKHVFAMSASACSTSTGSFDNLDAIADFCEQYNIWFHVDGAHGASLLLVDDYKFLLRGIQRADSVVWDGHKMMMMPALVTAVLFKDSKHASQNFLQKAEYIYSDEENDDSWVTLGKKTIECTKNMMVLKLYSSLMKYGTVFFANYISSRIKLAKNFANYLSQQPDFEIAIEPECNIVCFRYIQQGISKERSDEIQLYIFESILKEGLFYITKTSLQDKIYLRVSIMNPLTSIEHLKNLIFYIRKIYNKT